MPRLFTHNVQVDKWNNFQLSELAGDPVVLEARTRGPEHQVEFLKKNLLNIVIGLTLAAVTTVLDYRMLRAYAPFVYVFSVLGLLAVLSPLGSTINGSHSWIQLPGGFFFLLCLGLIAVQDGFLQIPPGSPLPASPLEGGGECLTTINIKNRQ